MSNFKTYGSSPFKIIVVHGGPGAAGEMQQVASNLGSRIGVIEPWQTERTLEGQLAELKAVCEEAGEPPVTLVGYSWGAWLVFMLAARYPELAKKIVLISSGPFEAKYAENLMQNRLSRLSPGPRITFQELLRELEQPGAENPKALKQLGELLAKADSYELLPEEEGEVTVDQEIYQGVWPKAAELRKSGRLLQLGALIQCPVTAIHGDSDPHPASGVKEPLEKVVKNFKFILLEKCGHTPWKERHAKEQFYETLDQELA